MTLPSHVCRHCGRACGFARRNLCRGCYDDPDIRARYGVRYRNDSPVPTASRSPLPAEPTAAPPGSEDRIAVLVDRALRGEALFHPADATLLGTAHD